MKKFFWIYVAALGLLFSCAKEENVYYTGDDFDMKASKMEQIGGLFDAIARNPEMSDQLVTATAQNYSHYTELLPLSDQAIPQRGKARGAAFSQLFLAISRQPEAYDLLDAAAARFLGPYNPSYISPVLLGITRDYAMSALYESLARQPEADSLLNLACLKYLNFEILQEE